MEESAPTMHVKLLDRIVSDLTRDYQGVFSPETVERYVYESYASLLRTAKIRTYLPVLAERFTRDRLRALALAEGKIASAVPQVLFVCVHNSGRSQMAAALLSHYAGGRVEVRSAGSQPGAGVNPVVAEILRERGIDVSEAYPKPLTDDAVRASDYVITMGCGDVCPIYPGKRYLDWQLNDPAEESPEVVREIADEVDVRVRDLMQDMGL